MSKELYFQTNDDALSDFYVDLDAEDTVTVSMANGENYLEAELGIDDVRQLSEKLHGWLAERFLVEGVK